MADKDNVKKSASLGLNYGFNDNRNTHNSTAYKHERRDDNKTYEDKTKSQRFSSGSTSMEKHGEFLDGGDFYHFHRAHETQVKSDENIAHAKYTDPAFFRASADEVAAEADARARIESSRYNYLSNRDRSEYEHKSRKHESNSRRFQSLVNSDSNNRAAYYHYKANENASKRAYKNNKKQRKHERKMYKKKLKYQKRYWAK